MRNIWNPWHGCIKKSEGCLNCYVYYFDNANKKDTSKIYRVKTNFNYPLSKDKNKEYKLVSGTTVYTCITSDFFLKEADIWRKEAWDIIRLRKDILFYIITKRPERIKDCLPDDWNDGWDNVHISISAENQKRLDERIEIVKELKIKHKGIILAPLLENVTVYKYLDGIDQVTMDGENYEGARIFDYEWAKSVKEECMRHDVTFVLKGVGHLFMYKGKVSKLTKEQSINITSRLGMNYRGKEVKYNLIEDKELKLF
jgi:protein gp37